MGKSKKAGTAQRTKKGTAAASSAAFTAGAAGGFVGFAAFGQGGAGAASVGTVAGASAAAAGGAGPKSSAGRRRQRSSQAAEKQNVKAAAFYGGTDSNAALLFRKLAKKDTVTKVRALDDIVELLGGLGTIALEQALPHVLYCYQQLSLHNAHRVRERANAMLWAAVKAIKAQAKGGKAFRPYVRAVLAPWTRSCSDPHRDVRNTARLAMQEAFPGGRWPRVAAANLSRLLPALQRGSLGQLAINMRTRKGAMRAAAEGGVAAGGGAAGFAGGVGMAAGGVGDISSLSNDEREELWERVQVSSLLAIAELLSALEKDDNGLLSDVAVGMRARAGEVGDTVTREAKGASSAEDRHSDTGDKEKKSKEEEEEEKKKKKKKKKERKKSEAFLATTLAELLDCGPDNGASRKLWQLLAAGHPGSVRLAACAMAEAAAKAAPQLFSLPDAEKAEKAEEAGVLDGDRASFRSYVTRTAVAVAGNVLPLLSERSPANHQAAFSCLLAFLSVASKQLEDGTSAMDAVWQNIDPTRAVILRVRGQLGGNGEGKGGSVPFAGNAEAGAGVLLPLLSFLPVHVPGDSKRDSFKNQEKKKDGEEEREEEQDEEADGLGKLQSSFLAAVWKGSGLGNGGSSRTSLPLARAYCECVSLLTKRAALSSGQERARTGTGTRASPETNALSAAVSALAPPALAYVNGAGVKALPTMVAQALCIVRVGGEVEGATVSAAQASTAVSALVEEVMSAAATMAAEGQGAGYARLGEFAQQLAAPAAQRGGETLCTAATAALCAGGLSLLDGMRKGAGSAAVLDFCARAMQSNRGRELDVKKNAEADSARRSALLSDVITPMLEEQAAAVGATMDGGGGASDLDGDGNLLPALTNVAAQLLQSSTGANVEAAGMLHAVLDSAAGVAVMAVAAAIVSCIPARILLADAEARNAGSEAPLCKALLVAAETAFECAAVEGPGQHGGERRALMAALSNPAAAAAVGESAWASIGAGVLSGLESPFPHVALDAIHSFYLFAGAHSAAASALGPDAVVRASRSVFFLMHSPPKEKSKPEVGAAAALAWRALRPARLKTRADGSPALSAAGESIAAALAATCDVRGEGSTKERTDGAREALHFATLVAFLAEDEEGEGETNGGTAAAAAIWATMPWSVATPHPLHALRMMAVLSSRPFAARTTGEEGGTSTASGPSSSFSVTAAVAAALCLYSARATARSPSTTAGRPSTAVSPEAYAVAFADLRLPSLLRCVGSGEGAQEKGASAILSIVRSFCDAIKAVFATAAEEKSVPHFESAVRLLTRSLTSQLAAIAGDGGAGVDDKKKSVRLLVPDLAVLASGETSDNNGVGRGGKSAPSGGVGSDDDGDDGSGGSGGADDDKSGGHSEGGDGEEGDNGEDSDSDDDDDDGVDAVARAYAESMSALRRGNTRPGEIVWVCFEGGGDRPRMGVVTKADKERGVFKLRFAGNVGGGGGRSAIRNNKNAELEFTSTAIVGVGPSGGRRYTASLRRAREQQQQEEQLRTESRAKTKRRREKEQREREREEKKAKESGNVSARKKGLHDHLHDDEDNADHEEAGYVPASTSLSLSPDVASRVKAEGAALLQSALRESAATVRGVRGQRSLHRNLCSGLRVAANAARAAGERVEVEEAALADAEKIVASGEIEEAAAALLEAAALCASPPAPQLFADVLSMVRGAIEDGGEGHSGGGSGIVGSSRGTASNAACACAESLCVLAARNADFTSCAAALDAVAIATASSCPAALGARAAAAELLGAMAVASHPQRGAQMEMREQRQVPPEAWTLALQLNSETAAARAAALAHLAAARRGEVCKGDRLWYRRKARGSSGRYAVRHCLIVAVDMGSESYALQWGGAGGHELNVGFDSKNLLSGPLVLAGNSGDARVLGASIARAIRAVWCGVRQVVDTATSGTMGGLRLARSARSLANALPLVTPSLALGVALAWNGESEGGQDGGDENGSKKEDDEEDEEEEEEEEEKEEVEGSVENGYEKGETSEQTQSSGGMLSRVVNFFTGGSDNNGPGEGSCTDNDGQDDDSSQMDNDHAIASVKAAAAAATAAAEAAKEAAIEGVAGLGADGTAAARGLHVHLGWAASGMLAAAEGGELGLPFAMSIYRLLRACIDFSASTSTSLDVLIAKDAEEKEDEEGGKEASEEEGEGTGKEAMTQNVDIELLVWPVILREIEAFHQGRVGGVGGNRGKTKLSFASASRTFEQGIAVDAASAVSNMDSGGQSENEINSLAAAYSSDEVADPCTLLAQIRQEDARASDWRGPRFRLVLSWLLLVSFARAAVRRTKGGGSPLLRAGIEKFLGNNGFFHRSLFRLLELVPVEGLGLRSRGASDGPHLETADRTRAEMNALRKLRSRAALAAAGVRVIGGSRLEAALRRGGPRPRQVETGAKTTGKARRKAHTQGSQSKHHLSQIVDAESLAVAQLSNRSTYTCSTATIPCIAVPLQDLSAAAQIAAGETLAVLPSMARHWFAHVLPRGDARAVERYVSKYVTPALLVLQFEALKVGVSSSSASEKSGLSVAGRGITAPGARERQIIAMYTKKGAGEDDDSGTDSEDDDSDSDDETGTIKMEVTMRIPSAYPLLTIRAESGQLVGISEAKKRRWDLQMTSILGGVGTLQDAIEVWRSNAASQVEGVEPCPICYHIVHTVTAKLPRIRCQTCNNKFHSQCLVHWFQSSHKSTCPLCRSAF